MGILDSRRRGAACLLICFTAWVSPLVADEASIAQKLANRWHPWSACRYKFNYDDNYGLGDEGSIWRTNVQPVIPFSLNDDWNLISRTILPVVFQSDFPVPGRDESGLGDTVQSLFFSPRSPRQEV